MNKLKLLAMLSVLALTGCPANQTQMQKAATASQQAMIVVQGFQQGEITAYNQGKECVAAAITSATKAACVIISDEDHLFIQQSVETIAQVDQTVNSCISSAATAAAASTCANTAISTIITLQANGDLHIKSASARQDFDLTMIGAKTALSVISTILGGA